MAIVQKASNAVASVASFSPSLTGVTAGNTLVLCVCSSGFSDTTPTDSASQTWSKAFYLANGACSVAVYYLLSANAGTHNLTVSHGGSAFDSWSLVEIPTCTAVDVVSTLGSGSNTITTLSTPSMTTTNASDAIFAMLSVDAATGLTNAGITDPPTGYTSVYVQQNSSAFEGCEIAYKEVSSIGAQAATWTFTADAAGSLYAAGAASFKLSASGGAALACAGIAKAVGSASITGQSQFTGAGLAKATGAGTFSTSGSPAAFVGAGVASAAGVGALTGKAQFAGAGACTAAGSAALTIAGMPTVTLRQHWYQPVGVGNAGMTRTFGPNPISVTAGSTLIAIWSAADLGAVNQPTDNAGTFTIPTNGLQNAAGSDHIWLGMAHQANASGGNHTITPQTITTDGGGELAIWIFEVTNMPSTANVRGLYPQSVISGANSWTLTTDSAPQTGDVAFTATCYENTVVFPNARLTDPPAGWISDGSEQAGDIFIPTAVAHRLPTSNGALTSSWSTPDTTVSEHLAITMVLVPTAGGGGQSVLNGSGRASASGSAALGGGLLFAGAGVCAATGSGALTTRAVLAGAGNATAIGAGSLSNGVSLAGAGSATAVGAGVLTVRAALAGAGAGTAAGTGALSISVALAGAGLSGAAGAATLTTGSAGASLAGVGAAAAAGAAFLTVSMPLTGAGTAAAAGIATLSGGSAGASMVGSGAANATGSGALTTRAAMAGGGFAIATAAGVLTIGGGGVSFIGNGAAGASGSGAFTARPRFSGSGAARVVGSGVLAIASPFVSGNEAVWRVPARVVATRVASRPSVVEVPARRISALATD